MDVQYMKSQGSAAEYSFQFLVDSATRDREAWPSPNDYEVSFATPFRNVFSLELVDCSIPRTEYTIEAGGNTLIYSTAPDSSIDIARAAGNAREVTVPPGDYNLPQLVVALNDAFAAAGDDFPVTVLPASNPAEISNRIEMNRARAFAVFPEASSIRKVLGFGDPQFGNFPSVPVATPAEVVFQGPVVIPETVYELDLPVRQPVILARESDITEITFRGAVRGALAATVRVDVTVDDVVIGTTTVSVSGESTWVAAFSAPPRIPAQTTAYIGLTATAYTSPVSPRVVVYRGESYDDTPFVEAAAGSGWAAVPGAVLSIEVLGTRELHVATPPGLVNLTGERFVLIRAPDVEEHLNRDRAYEPMAPGLGMVKLSGYGYRDARMDFVGFRPRRFHPIGKLRSLRIRLTKGSGELYNCRGLDHHLLMVLSFYGQAPSGGVPKMINPKYTPDLREFLLEKMQLEETDRYGGG